MSTQKDWAEEMAEEILRAVPKLSSADQIKLVAASLHVAALTGEKNAVNTIMKMRAAK